MGGLCEGRIVVVTGAGRGIGREHALLFAQEGAKVVVNDLGAERDGTGSSTGPAGEVVDLIRSRGGEAIANGDDVSDVEGAERLVQSAIDEFGRLDVLVNNAGILRDRMLTNMEESEWDAVIKVHLKGTWAPARAAARHWRERSKAGEEVSGRLINTTSPSGIFGNVGQTNYGAAKAGIASFTIIAGLELERYGVTANAIAPVALTRMTEDLGGMGSRPQPAEGEWNPMGPENIAPIVVWLGSEASAGVNGRVFLVGGGRVSVAEGWRRGPTVEKQGLWEPGELGELMANAVKEAAPNSTMRS